MPKILARNSVPPGSVEPQSARDRLLPWAWFVIVLIILWVLLRASSYGERASVYRAVALAAEAFRSPVWAALLAAAAAGLFWMARRSRVERAGSVAAPAPNVLLRAEPSGCLTVVVPGTRGALAADHVIRRNRDRERELLLRFDGLARRASSLSSDAAGGALEGGARRDAAREIEAEARALGLDLAEVLLGADPRARDRLLDLPGGALLLSMQPELTVFPWELLVLAPGARFLWQLFDVSRQIRGTSAAVPAAQQREGPARLLLLANLEAGGARRLPHAEREAEAIMDVGASRPDVLRVVRKTPADANELRLVLREGYDVVHFAGHGVTSAAGAVGWMLPSGSLVEPEAVLGSSVAPPRLVFSNCCASAPGPGLAERGGRDLALGLMRAGVPAYLGTQWEAPDEGAAAFAGAFYRSLATGAPLAQAVGLARSRVMGRFEITWANYVLYGDPELALAPGGRR